MAVISSLSALSTLESAARQQAKARPQSQNLCSQTEQIQILKQRRDELQQKLQNLSGSAKGTDGAGDLEAAGQDKKLTSALMYLSELKEKLCIYKLTGVSVVETKPNSKVLCFTTFFKGFYLESYHLKLQRLDSGEFKILNHSLPPFIVFSILPANLLIKDVQAVVRPVQEALSMFVLRREELKLAQAKFSDTLHILDSSTAVDFVRCHLDVGENNKVEITLKYLDLNNSVPSEVNVRPWKPGGKLPEEDLSQNVMDQLKNIFYGNNLSAAISSTAQTLLDYFAAEEQADET